MNSVRDFEDAPNGLGTADSVTVSKTNGRPASRALSMPSRASRLASFAFRDAQPAQRQLRSVAA